MYINILIQVDYIIYVSAIFKLPSINISTCKRFRYNMFVPRYESILINCSHDKEYLIFETLYVFKL